MLVSARNVPGITLTLANPAQVRVLEVVVVLKSVSQCAVYGNVESPRHGDQRYGARGVALTKAEASVTREHLTHHPGALIRREPTDECSRVRGSAKASKRHRRLDLCKVLE